MCFCHSAAELASLATSDIGRAEFAPPNCRTPGVQVVLYVITTQAESENEQLRNAAALFIFILHVFLCNLWHRRRNRPPSASYFHMAADLKVPQVLFHLRRRASCSLLFQAVELLQSCRTRCTVKVSAGCSAFVLCSMKYTSHLNQKDDKQW